jgi:hypothetical protein
MPRSSKTGSNSHILSLCEVTYKLLKHYTVVISVIKQSIYHGLVFYTPKNSAVRLFNARNSQALNRITHQSVGKGSVSFFVSFLRTSVMPLPNWSLSGRIVK